MMSILISIVVGAVAGFLADLAFKSFSFSTLYQVILGIGGGLLGHFILDGELHTMLGLPDIISKVAEAFIGSCAILGLIMLYRKFTK